MQYTHFFEVKKKRKKNCVLAFSWEIIRPHGMQIAHPPIYEIHLMFSEQCANEINFSFGLYHEHKESAITLIALIITLVWMKERPVIYMLCYERKQQKIYSEILLFVLIELMGWRNSKENNTEIHFRKDWFWEIEEFWQS